MGTTSVLVVDDDPHFRNYLANALRSNGYGAEVAGTGRELMARLASGTLPSVILLDVLMPDSDGIELMRKIQDGGTKIPVIMLSGLNEVRTVVEAMKLGACDFLIKPFDESSLFASLQKVTSPTPLPTSIRSAPIADDHGFVTLNSKMRRLAEIVARVAHTDVPILIAGESGVGKEVMAKHAHQNSPRHDRPFIKVNCAALPQDLLESELFGYKQGAFTGAVANKPGKFQIADGGTLLLDEIGEMSPLLQAKLLQVLQDGTFSSLGSTKTVKVDVRIIAATNIHIEKAVADGNFREDLYFRLNVIRIDLPPLRQRREDIPGLCNYFCGKYRERYGAGGRQFLPPDLLNRFVLYDWPGNIRELENCIKRFLVMPDDGSLFAEMGSPQSNNKNHPLTFADHSLSLLSLSAVAAKRAEQELVRQVLQETNGNRKLAARKMNICYKALLNKLKRWQTQPAA